MPYFSMNHIFYLGPAGTFSEYAADVFRARFCNPDVTPDFKPFPTISEVISAACNLACNPNRNEGVSDTSVFAAVPIENSIEGVVNATLDGMVFDADLFVQAALALPVEQCLLALGDEPITAIMSHPHALAQCGVFLRERYPNAELLPVTSTAAAAQAVATAAVPTGTAAIAHARAAEIYGLKTIAADIADEKSNVTTFALLSNADTSKPEAGKKTLLAFTTENKPGDLYKTLNIFSLWDVNLSSITSRPFRKRPGEYVFYVEIECGDDPQAVSDALTMVKRKVPFFKNLGTYATVKP